jgi:hypothetical protein
VLAGKLGHASSESVIWPELVELVSDEEREVLTVRKAKCIATSGIAVHRWWPLDQTVSILSNRILRVWRSVAFRWMLALH